MNLTAPYFPQGFDKSTYMACTINQTNFAAYDNVSIIVDGSGIQCSSLQQEVQSTVELIKPTFILHIHLTPTDSVLRDVDLYSET
jgi:hypothetical protein